MSFSIVIPSKTASNLVSCIKAIREAGETARIIVVDDGVNWGSGCDDGETAALPAWAWPFNVMKGAKPFCFSVNVNIGIRAAEDDDVIVVNDDALLKTRGGFKTLYEAARANAEYGIIGAVTNVTGQPLQQQRHATVKGHGLRQVPHIAFVCVLIPQSTIGQVGMLDETYKLGYEDRDYCEAVNRAGLKVGVHDGCFVDHGSLVSTIRGPGGPGYDKTGADVFRAKWGVSA